MEPGLFSLLHYVSVVIGGPRHCFELTGQLCTDSFHSVSHTDFSSISSALLPFFAQCHRSHHSIKIKLEVMTCSCGSQTLLTPTLNPLLHLSPAVEPQATPGHHTLLCGLFFLSPLSVRPFLCFCLCLCVLVFCQMGHCNPGPMEEKILLPVVKQSTQ